LGAKYLAPQLVAGYGINPGSYLAKPRHSILKKAFIRFAEITFSSEIIPVEGSSILHTAATTYCKIPADQAFAAQISFGSCKRPLLIAGSQFFNWRLEDVTQLPPRLNKKITTEGVAGMLNDNVLAALSVERTNRVFARQVKRKDRIKVADAQPLLPQGQACPRAGGDRPIIIPAVEYSAPELAKLLRRNREVRNFARSRIKFHAGDKLKIPNAVFYEKIKQLIRVVGGFIIQQGERVELHLMFFTSFDGWHDLVKGAMASVVEAIAIVQFFWAVDTNADKKVIIVKELAPIIVEQNCVGLQRVAHFLPGSAVFFLEFHHPLIEVKAHQSRLTALPGKPGYRKTQLHIIFDQFFKDLIAHPLFAV